MGGSFVCKEEGCPKSFTSGSSLKAHVQGEHKEGFRCEECGKRVSDPSNLRRHRKSMHSAEESEKFNCPVCQKMIKGPRKDNLVRHMKKCCPEVRLRRRGTSGQSTSDQAPAPVEQTAAAAADMAPPTEPLDSELVADTPLDCDLVDNGFMAGPIFDWGPHVDEAPADATIDFDRVDLGDTQEVPASSSHQPLPAEDTGADQGAQGFDMVDAMEQVVERDNSPLGQGYAQFDVNAPWYADYQVGERALALLPLDVNDLGERLGALWEMNEKKYYGNIDPQLWDEFLNDVE